MKSPEESVLRYLQHMTEGTLGEFDYARLHVCAVIDGKLVSLVHLPHVVEAIMNGVTENIKELIMQVEG